MKNNEVVLYEAKANASTNIWGNISSTAIVVVPTLIPLCLGSLSSTLITLGITSAISLFTLSLKRASLTSNLYNSAFLTLMPEGENKNDILSYPALYRSEREAYLKSEGAKYNRKSDFRSFLRKLFLGKANYVHNESTVDAYGSINRKIVEISSREIVIVDRKTESDLAIWLNAVKNAYMLDPDFNLKEAKIEEREERRIFQMEKAEHSARIAVDKEGEKIANAKRQTERYEERITRIAMNVEREKIASAERTARIFMDKEKAKFQKLAKSNQENLKTIIKMRENNAESESVKTVNIRSGVLDQDTLERTKGNAEQLKQMIFEREVQHQKDAEKIAEQKMREGSEQAKIVRQQKSRIETNVEIRKTERVDREEIDRERADRYRQLYIEGINRQNAALDYENAFAERLVKQSEQEALSELKPSKSTPVVSKEQPQLKDIERVQLKHELLRNQMGMYTRSQESRLCYRDVIERTENQMMKYRALIEQLVKQSEQEALSELKPPQSTPAVSKDSNFITTSGW